MDLNHLRQSFLDFFASKKHKILESAPLIPQHDDTLLFINAGMAPLKPFFLGQLKPPATNLVSCQKCIRAGGKHNDLDQVGHTKRHHTFFEMCGNFSFGGYAHKEAIDYAWEYLTKILHLNEQRLHVTVHPEDETSYAAWSEILPQERIYKLSENEWSMGGDGPCGKCTEIFYDHGEDIKGTIEEGDRFVEIWNIVIMTHQVVGETKTPLTHICIDTGMGLERIVAVLGGTPDNYEAPFFWTILEDMARVSGKTIDAGLKIMIDHARATVFAISDGVMPNTWGRGYVLRKIIRRALKNGSIELFKMCINYVIDNMNKAYPDILGFREIIIEQAEQENEQLNNILTNAEQNIIKLIANSKIINKEQVYTLYDRHGISPDITEELATRLGLQVELEGFEEIQAKRKGETKSSVSINAAATHFLGYENLECEATVIDLIEHEGSTYLITDQTVFYAEAGGQEADHGTITGEDWSAEVIDVVKNGQVYLHKVLCKGEVKINIKGKMYVDKIRRKGIMQHHSATHLLLKALRLYLGDSVIQQGSSVKVDGLRFDFLYNKPVEAKVLNQIEKQVNLWIQENALAKVSLKTQDEAKSCGALCMAGEKYGEIVRVVEIGGSIELCCGTHVKAAGDIGFFTILRESSVRANVRRIEACAGMPAYEKARENIDYIKRLAFILKTQPEHLEKTIERLINKEGKKKESGSEILEGVTREGLKWIIAYYKEAPQGLMLKDSDGLVKKADFVLIINYIEDRIALILRGKDAVITLNNLITSFGGAKAGGRPDMAQGGLSNQPPLQEIKERFLSLIK